MNHPPSQTSTGYGRRHRNYFDGYENKYEIWGVKFLAYLRLSKLLDVITRPAGTDGPEENDVDVAARKSATHDTAYCRRKKDSVIQVLDSCDNMDKCGDNECHSFVFRECF